MNKIKRIGMVAVLTLALSLGAGGAEVADGAVTLGSTSVASDGVLTLTGNDVSVWSVASAAADDDLTISVTGGKDSSLILSSTGTAADALQITTSAGGLNISATGNAVGEDLTLDTVGAATEMRLTSASTEDDALVLSATADTGGVYILAGDGEVAAVGTDESIELRATADTIVALTAAGSLVIDGATTDQANTNGALDIDVDTITASGVGASLDFQVGDAAASSTYYGLKSDITIDTDASQTPTVYGNYTGITVNEDTAVTYGLGIIALDAGTNVVTAGILIENLQATDIDLTDAILIRATTNDSIATALNVSDAEITTALAFGANAIDGTYFDVAATTGAVTLAQQAAGTSPLTITGVDDGTAAILDLNISNVSGTLIDVDYVTETQTGDLTGLDLNLNTNVTAAVDQDVTGVNVQTPALTAADTDGTTTTYTGYNISAAGALDVAEGANTVTLAWRGLNVTMPAIDTGTNDTTTATGILISAGTVTAGSGTENSVAIDASDSDIINAINVGANVIYGTGGATINFDNFDVAAAGGITVAAAEGLDTSGAGALEIGYANATSILYGNAAATTAHTFASNTTGTATVVLPNDAIGAAEIDDAVCTQVISGEINPTETKATDDYINLVTGAGDTTEANVDIFRVPVAMKAHNLSVLVDVAPTVDDQWKITLREAGSDETLTCTITGSDTTCTDTSNTSTLAAGAKLTVSVSSSAGTADPAAAAAITVSFCLTE